MLQRVFKQESYSTPTANRKKVIFLVIQFQILLQNSSFFWQPNMPIQGWEGYSSFWAVLRFSSLDSLAATLNMSSEFVFAIISMIAFSVLSLIISALLIKFKKEIPCVFHYLQICCIEIVCNIYFIPSVISLLTLAKYSSHDYTYLEEYPSNIPGSVLNYGVLGELIGIIALILLVALTLIYESCSYEMSYNLENNFYSQSQPYVGIIVKLFLLTQCLFITNFQLTSYDTFIKVDTFLYLIASMLMLYFVPHHCLFTNAVKFLVLADSTLIATAFLFGHLNNSSTLIFVVTLILQPFVIYLSYEIIKFRISKFKSLQSSRDMTFTNFEHSARSQLMDEKKSNRVLQELNTQAQLSPNSLFKVLCANYCLETLKDPSLAQIKIEKITTFTLNLPVMFSVYKCKYTLNKINLSQSKGLKWVIFSQHLDLVMKTDLQVCNSLMAMYNKLLEPNQELSKLKSLVLRSNSLIDTATKCYLSLLDQVPDSKLILELYGLFLIDILNDKTQGLTYFDKEKQLRKQKLFDKRSQHTGEESCIFIVSGNPGEQGRFLYASGDALDFLKIPKATLSNTYVSEFIPGPFQKIHQQYLVNFADKCLTNTIPCNVFSYLLINKYLVECTSTTECVVYEQNTYFVTFLDPLGDASREIVLIDLNGIIISHSAGLRYILEIESKQIEGRNINDYLPIHCNELRPGIPVKVDIVLDISMTTKTVAILLDLKNTAIKYFTLYLTTDESEIEEWFNQVLRPEGSLEQIETVSPLSTKKVRFTDHTQKAEEENKDPEIKSPDSTNGSSIISVESLQESRALAVSLRSLKIISLLIIISVRNIQKIALIGTIIAVSIFLYEMSIALSDLSNTENLGELMYTLLLLALITRALDLKFMAKVSTTITLTSGYNNLAKIQSYYWLLANSTQNWQNCPAGEVARNNLIPNWRLVDGKPTVYYSNLQDYVGEAMRTVRLI